MGFNVSKPEDTIIDMSEYGINNDNGLYYSPRKLIYKFDFGNIYIGKNFSGISELEINDVSILRINRTGSGQNASIQFHGTLIDQANYYKDYNKNIKVYVETLPSLSTSDVYSMIDGNITKYEGLGSVAPFISKSSTLRMLVRDYNEIEKMTVSEVGNIGD